MTANDDEIVPSGNEAFDRARDYLAHLREEEALDWFQIAADAADDAEVRASAAAFVAGILLSRGRPWEVTVWAGIVRDNSPRPDLGNLLDAAAHLQLGEVDAARTLLENVTDPTDRWFPASVTAARIARAHVLYLDDEIDGATAEVLAAFAADPFAPDVWDAFARLCAETDFDPTEFVDRIPDDHVLEILAVAPGVGSEGRRPHRGAHLAAPHGRSAGARAGAVVRGEARLHARRWNGRPASARPAWAGCARCSTAPTTPRSTAPERVLAATLAHVSFGDTGARSALAKAVPGLTDDELPGSLREVWSLAGMLAATVIVVGADDAGPRVD